MEQMNIASAKYLKNQDIQQINGENTYVNVGENIAITAIIDGNRLDYIPLDPANRHYAEIMRQVEAGELTIQEADQT